MCIYIYIYIYIYIAIYPYTDGERRHYERDPDPETPSLRQCNKHSMSDTLSTVVCVRFLFLNIFISILFFKD